MVTGDTKEQYGEVRDQLTKPDEWFKLEVIAKGSRIQTFVNGAKAANLVNAEGGPLDALGPIRFGVKDEDGKLKIRKIEIKELPPQ